MGANHDIIKEEPGKDFKVKIKVADIFKFLHNSGMLIKDQIKHFVETMKAIYVGICVGLVTAMLLVEIVKTIFRQFFI
jgi:hypothetical protein